MKYLILFFLAIALLAGFLFFQQHFANSEISKNSSPTSRADLTIKEISYKDCEYSALLSDTSVRTFNIGNTGVEGRCGTPTDAVLSSSNKFLVYESISGGIDTEIKVYSVERDSSYRLDFFGSSAILKEISAENDDIVIIRYEFEGISTSNTYSLAELFKDTEASSDYFLKTDNYKKIVK